MRGNKNLLAVAVLFAAFTLFITLSLQFRHDFFSEREEARKVEDIYCVTGNSTEKISLPVILGDLAPRSLVILQGEIETEGEESLLVTSHFSHARIYLNDILAYEFWPEGSYPSFMKDPLFGHVIVPLPENSGFVRFHIEYESPVQRSELSIPAIYAGREGALVQMLYKEKGASVLFSLIMIFFGILLFLVWVVFLREIASGSSVLWLGMFSLSAGAWVLGECELGAFLLPYPFLLYVMDYLGMFCVCIPLLRFWLEHPQAQVKKILHAVLYLHYGSVLAAILLQLTGAMDLMKTLYWFHIISPLGFAVLAGVLLWEYFYCHSTAALYFAPAGVLLMVFVILELMNYWFSMSYSFTALFQIGLLAFIVWLGFISGYFVRQSMRTAYEKEQLAYEVTAMGCQLNLQQEQYERMMQNVEAEKMLRHDMRHHIAVMKRLLADDDKEELVGYMDRLENIVLTAAEKTYCLNSPVNAVASHYLSLAEQEGVQVKAQLDIPVETGIIPTMDICILVGNLLENALEACRRLEGDDCDRFIHVHSLIAGDTLSIIITNSFDGIYHMNNGLYLSRKSNTGKPARTGVGLSSVKAICERYHGIARWEIKGNAWKVSVLVHMEEAADE